MESNFHTNKYSEVVDLLYEFLYTVYVPMEKLCTVQWATSEPVKDYAFDRMPIILSGSKSKQQGTIVLCEILIPKQRNESLEKNVPSISNFREITLNYPVSNCKKNPSGSVNSNVAFTTEHSNSVGIKNISASGFKQAPIWSLNGHTLPPTAISWNNDGKTLLSGGADCQTILWDVQLETMSHYFKGEPHKEIRDIAWITQSTFVNVTEDGQTLLWDLKEAKPVRKLQKQNEPVLTVAKIDDTTLVTGGGLRIDQHQQGSSLVFYDLRKEKYIKVVQHKANITKVLPYVWTDGSVCLASAGLDCSAHLWDFNNQHLNYERGVKPVFSHEIHTNGVKDIDYLNGIFSSIDTHNQLLLWTPLFW